MIGTQSDYDFVKLICYACSLNNISCTFREFSCIKMYSLLNLASVAKLDAGLTGDQEVAGLILARSWNVLSWRVIMKYFLWSFSPFC